jgi:hypothetical protein
VARGKKRKIGRKTGKTKGWQGILVTESGIVECRNGREDEEKDGNARKGRGREESHANSGNFGEESDDDEH